MLSNLDQRLSCIKSRTTVPLRLKRVHHLQRSPSLKAQVKTLLSLNKLKIMETNMTLNTIKKL